MVFGRKTPFRQAGANSIGVIHGDIKPGNILMFRRANGEYFAKLCDFGYSSLFANENETFEIDLPLSTPWHAPELDRNRFGLSVLEAKRTDIYSAGLVCLWLLFGKGRAQPVENLWDESPEFLNELKRNDSIPNFVTLNLQELLGVDEEMKSNLQSFFRLTTMKEVEKRIPSLAKFVENTPTPMGSPVHTVVPIFSIRQAFGELIQHDFLIRRQVITCLQAQANTVDCPYRLNAGFQLAVCCRLGFGGPLSNNDVDDRLTIAGRTMDELDAEIESIRTRDTTYEAHYSNPEIEALVEDGFLYGQLQDIPSRDQFLREQEKETGSSYELEVMKHVLTRDEAVILKGAIARSISGQGRYRQARIMLSELFNTLDIDSTSGHDHPFKLRLASEITTLLRLEGELDEALAFGTYVLSTREKALNCQDLRVADSRTALARVHIQKGSFDQAEILLRQALEPQKAVLGTTHPIYVDTMNILGAVLTETNRHNEASKVWLEVAENSKGALTNEHPLSLSVIGNIATWLDDTGNYFGSERLYRSQLASTVSWAGPKHPDVAMIMSNLAIVIKNQDRYHEAEEYARKAYEMSKDILGPEHHLTLVCLNNVAQILVRWERYDEAKTMHSTVTAKYDETLGPYHAHTLSSQLNLASVFREQNRLEEARSLQLRVIATYEQSPCEDKSLIISARSQLATTLHHLEDHIGEEHPDTWATMVNFAAVLQADGQPETQWQEVEELFRFAINRYNEKFAERHSRTLTTAFWLAILWVKMGQVEKAAETLEQTYLGFKEVLGEDNEWTRIVWRYLNGE
ncbi:MAG: hypothetical protein Q9226_006798 [Calogaya cf. arnoldii]